MFILSNLLEGAVGKGNISYSQNHTRLSQKLDFTFHYIIRKDLTGNIKKFNLKYFQ